MISNFNKQAINIFKSNNIDLTIDDSDKITIEPCYRYKYLEMGIENFYKKGLRSWK